MMKVVLIVALALIAVVALVVIVVLVVGSRLPVAHSVSRSIKLRQQPSAVYGVVRDVTSYHVWRSDIKSVEILSGEAEPFRYREAGSNGVVGYQLDEDVPNERMVTRILDTDLGYSGSWTYEFVAIPDGTLVTITESGEVSNIFFRFMSRYVFGHTASIDAYLQSLAGKFGETVVAGRRD